ncbi:MAG: endonuclease MutS2 [Armatimonadetes bacterium]|nr:endonuclease MutS2 [Armatimonadota bacterium]
MREVRALRILEFQTIRDRLVACCQTEMGRTAAESILPEFDEESVWGLLDQTLEAFDLLGTSPPPSLAGVYDVRNSAKLAAKGGLIPGDHLHRIGVALSATNAFKSYLDATETAHLTTFATGLWPDVKLEGELLYSLDGDGAVRDEASPTLADLRVKKRAAQARIVERIQAYTTGRFRDYLSDPIYTIRDGRYVIPLKADHKGKIKGIVHDTSATGSTVFLEPEDVLNAANAARQVEAQEAEEEKRILKVLSSKVGRIADEIVSSVTQLGHLDLIFGKARLGAEMRAGVPIRANGPFIEIKGGRHPLLDRETAVPLDLEVSAGSSVVITGPNTGGKTVAIKTIGLFVAMLQCGMLPPAYHSRFGAFTQLWADIGDEQSLEQSLSTFSAHLKNIASALNNLQPGALVLLDEVGAGTDPAEGAALAQAFLLEFHEGGAAVLASTHYGELKAFAFSAEGFRNASMEFDSKSLKPTYRLILGAAGASQALKIAERYGIDKRVVVRADACLSEQHKDVAEMLQNLENAQKQARVAQSEADRRIAELRELEAKAERKLREAEDVRKRANERAHDAIESTLREIRIQSEDIIENLKKQGVKTDTIQKARQDLRALDELGRGVSSQFRNQEKAQEAPQKHVLRKGDIVQVLGMQQNGTLLEDATGKEVMVQLGVMKMKIDVRKLLPTNLGNKPPTAGRQRVNLAKTLNAKTEITLRNKRAEDALQELERFIDDAILGNVPFVRVVHGKGEGILRQITQDYLRKHKDVKSYRDGDATEGGQGVTIVNFK